MSDISCFKKDNFRLLSILRNYFEKKTLEYILKNTQHPQ